MQVQGIFLLNTSKKTGGARAPCAHLLVTSLTRTMLSQVRIGQNMLSIHKIFSKSQELYYIGQKEWLACPGIEPGPPKDTTNIFDTLKNPGNFVTLTAHSKRQNFQKKNKVFIRHRQFFSFKNRECKLQFGKNREIIRFMCLLNMDWQLYTQKNKQTRLFW